MYMARSKHKAWMNGPHPSWGLISGALRDAHRRAITIDSD
jgi:hypothetical protein